MAASGLFPTSLIGDLAGQQASFPQYGQTGQNNGSSGFTTVDLPFGQHPADKVGSMFGRHIQEIQQHQNGNDAHLSWIKESHRQVNNQGQKNVQHTIPVTRMILQSSDTSTASNIEVLTVKAGFQCVGTHNNLIVCVRAVFLVPCMLRVVFLC
jgi:hypothetical protein